VSGTGSGDAVQVFSAGAKPFTLTRTVPETVPVNENENLPSASVVAVWLTLDELKVICAPWIAAPVASCTTPRIVTCCAHAQETSRENRNRWETKLTFLLIGGPRGRFGVRSHSTR
jgi:hypothetical protein